MKSKITYWHFRDREQNGKEKRKFRRPRNIRSVPHTDVITAKPKSKFYQYCCHLCIWQGFAICATWRSLLLQNTALSFFPKLRRGGGGGGTQNNNCHQPSPHYELSASNGYCHQSSFCPVLTFLIIFLLLKI
jgi:hypothetical protein